LAAHCRPGLEEHLSVQRFHGVELRVVAVDKRVVQNVFDRIVESNNGVLALIEERGERVRAIACDVVSNDVDVLIVQP
jgi:hypothetical protein